MKRFTVCIAIDDHVLLPAEGSEELEQSQEKEYICIHYGKNQKQFPEHATCKIMKCHREF